MTQKEIRVLVIEDLKLAQIAAHHLFKQLHCNVHIVTDAARALEQLINNHYDIIFVDIQLPDINGFELARTIRNIEKRWTHMPLIAVTANFNEELESNTLEAGFDDYLTKPLTLETIRYTLLKHLDKSRLNASNLDAA